MTFVRNNSMFKFAALSTAKSKHRPCPCGSGLDKHPVLTKGGRFIRYACEACVRKGK